MWDGAQRAEEEDLPELSDPAEHAGHPRLLEHVARGREEPLDAELELGLVWAGCVGVLLAVVESRLAPYRSVLVPVGVEALLARIDPEGAPEEHARGGNEWREDEAVDERPKEEYGPSQHHDTPREGDLPLAGGLDKELCEEGAVIVACEEWLELVVAQKVLAVGGGHLFECEPAVGGAQDMVD